MAKDYSNIFGGSILSYVEETVGPIQNADNPFILASESKTGVKSDIRAYVASVRKNPGLKILFTVGLFALKINDAFQMKECFICLPASWPLLRYYFHKNLLEKALANAYLPETLPLDILRAVVAQCVRKNTKFTITEGLFLDKSGSPWNKFQWPDILTGITAVNYYWSKPGKEEDKGNTVTLFTLTPTVENKKDLSAGWYDRRRYGDWEQFVIPIFSDIALVESANSAVLNNDWLRLKELAAAGVNVNRRCYETHPVGGDIVTYTYLEKALTNNQMETAKMLAAKGAKMPPDAPALISGHADIALFNFVLDCGGDINAVDNVGYTALNRAVAFKNEPLIKHIISLGGKYRRQKHDKPVEIQKLINRGIKLID